MAIPSRVLNSGVTQLSTVSICGDGNASIAAAGTSAGDATTLTYVYNNVTTVGAGAGVKLPPTEMGETIIVKNTSANPLTVYPYNTSSSINNVGYGTINPDCSALFFAVSNTLWEELLKIAFRQAGKTAIFDESTGEQVPVCSAKATKASIAVSFR